MNRFPFILFLLLFIIEIICPEEFIPIYPEGKMPNSKGIKLDLIIENDRIIQVDKPGFFVFRPAKEENNGSSILICPGGGYHHITYDLSGFQIAKWLNTNGITAFVLIYRLPTSPDLIKREIAPIQDAQRAMKIIRASYQKWNLDTSRIGTFGISAGGHLSACLATINKDYSKIGDPLDNISFKPNFLILLSAVITMGNNTHIPTRNNLLGKNPSSNLIKKFSSELNVNSDTPPTFIIHAYDDCSVPVENSIMFFQALLKNGIPASLHIFPYGDHKLSIYNKPGSSALWTETLKLWLEEMNFIKN